MDYLNNSNHTGRFRIGKHMFARICGANFLASMLASLICGVPIFLTVHILQVPLKSLPINDVVWILFLILGVVLYLWCVIRLYVWLGSSKEKV